jgi:hypothetical protein
MKFKFKLKTPQPPKVSRATSDRSFGKLDIEVRQAVVTMADRIATGSSSVLDLHISKLGYPPNAAWLPVGWTGFSPVRKIETYYFAAIRADASSGGRALAMLARALSLDHPALLSDPAIMPFLTDVDIGPLSFAHYESLSPMVPLDKMVRRAILTLATHLSSGAGPSIVQMLDYLQVPEDEMYSILRESSSERDALSQVIAGEKDPVVATNQLLDFFEANGPALLQEQDIVSFRKKYPSQRRSSEPIGAPAVPRPLEGAAEFHE